MKSVDRMASVAFMLALALSLASTSTLSAQDASTAAASVVPPLIKFNGVIATPGTATRTGDAASARQVTATFSLYELQEGGSPLWSESQKVLVDEQGRYVVLLGATSSAGLPLDLFTSGKALWLGVQPQLSGAGELPRVLLVAVPYALKSSDSDTLGGKPASAYALAGAPAVVEVAGLSAAPSATANPAPTGSKVDAAAGKDLSVQPLAACSSVTSDGAATANAVAKFTTACNVENSLIRDNGTGVVVGGTAPGALFDVQFTTTGTSGTLYGQRALSTLNPGAVSSAQVNALWANIQTKAGNVVNFTGNTIASYSEMDHYGTGTVSNGIGAHGVVFNRAAGTIASAYGTTATVSNLSTGTITNGYGLWVNAPVNSGGGKFTNFTGVYISNPSAVSGAYGLFSAGGKNYFAGNVGIGTTTPGASLEVNGAAKFDGLVTFAPAQTFAGVGSGLTSVNAAELGGLLPSAFQPAGSYAKTTTANTFAGSQTVSTGNLSLSHGNLGLPATTSSAAGVITLGGTAFIHACCPTSKENTFVGDAGNLTAGGATNTYGENTAIGFQALVDLTSGGENVASGVLALSANTTGSNNTAVGFYSGNKLSSGMNSTFVGAIATATVNGLTNAAAIGYEAQVGESNAMVLGGTGSNAVKVGIGVTSPADGLDINNTIGTNILVGQKSGVNKFRVDNTGKGYFDGGTVTSGADFAESVAVQGKRSEYEPGDLLVIERGAHRRLTLSSTPYSTLVAGIYSTKPGLLATPHRIDDQKINEEVPLAVVGIVPCKVTAQNGAIEEGDLLVTSPLPGFAMKGTERSKMLGAVVGKALESLPKGTGVIQVLVTLQ